MAEQKNPQAQPELSLSEQTRIRREKLTNLQAEGQNPFVITRFDWVIHTARFDHNKPAFAVDSADIAPLNRTSLSS